MKEPDSRRQLVPLFQGAQRTAKSEVDQFRQIGWGNARLRALADERLSQGWWRLLWMPPSLPYHLHGGPYESVDSTTITKQLIFSSWVAAPTAIASLLSYEVQRRIFKGPRRRTPPGWTIGCLRAGPPQCRPWHCSGRNRSLPREPIR